MFDICYCFFFQTKTAYELRISDWSSDVCSSDLITSGTLPTLLLPTSDSPASNIGSSKERPPAFSRLTAWALRLVAPIAPVTTKRPPNSTRRFHATEPTIPRGERLPPGRKYVAKNVAWTTSNAHGSASRAAPASACP